MLAGQQIASALQGYESLSDVFVKSMMWLTACRMRDIGADFG
jgi:hypothetical protein